MSTVSVPYGDLFYLYVVTGSRIEILGELFPSPMGIFFICIFVQDWYLYMNLLDRGFRPLWGSFLFVLY